MVDGWRRYEGGLRGRPKERWVLRWMDRTGGIEMIEGGEGSEMRVNSRQEAGGQPNVDGLTRLYLLSVDVRENT